MSYCRGCGSLRARCRTMSAEAILSLTADCAYSARPCGRCDLRSGSDPTEPGGGGAGGANTTHGAVFVWRFDHPDLQAGWGHEIDVPNSEWRITAYTNLTFTYFLMGYDIGHWPAGELRQILEKRFRFRPTGTTGGRPLPLLELMRSPRRPSFYAVAQSAYDKAIQSPPVVGAAARGHGYGRQPGDSTRAKFGGVA
jgi:hypothetical protein